MLSTRVTKPEVQRLKWAIMNSRRSFQGMFRRPEQLPRQLAVFLYLLEVIVVCERVTTCLGADVHSVYTRMITE